MPPDFETHAHGGAGSTFATTHWSVVLRAGQSSDRSQAEALEKLCQSYWRPIYAYIRRRGCAPESAQDLTQGFFERLLEKSWLSDIDPNRAKFRSFLLTMVSRFLANEYDRAQAIKRGGGQLHLNVDDPALENQLAAEPEATSPERAFDRQWALTVLDRAFTRLEAESAGSRDRGAHFKSLQGFLAQEAVAGDYHRLAGELGLSSGAVAVMVHRLRHRYKELVRAEIAETLGNAAEVETEMRYLLEVLRS
ncbi:MAG: sigma-70 family RNA polymerase sigma factor [Verrucomicrobia bacterium]|nr:sigma-70 family RNA polymerase sigma factor [Verrucomicrobiota bacterium]MBI3871082.1 sigma-70 family RNA polymerase sigma factor [Verrucomicrobiota bacterium]